MKGQSTKRVAIKGTMPAIAMTVEFGYCGFSANRLPIRFSLCNQSVGVAFGDEARLDAEGSCLERIIRKEVSRGDIIAFILLTSA